jgi:hypothetical protein
MVYLFKSLNVLINHSFESIEKCSKYSSVIVITIKRSVYRSIHYRCSFMPPFEEKWHICFTLVGWYVIIYMHVGQPMSTQYHENLSYISYEGWWSELIFRLKVNSHWTKETIHSLSWELFPWRTSNLVHHNESVTIIDFKVIRSNRI